MVSYGIKDQVVMDTSIVTIDILAEFLEVAFHQILYTRDLYPSTIFEKCRKYNVPVQMSIHPLVNEYVEKAVEAIKLILGKHYLEKIVLAIYDGKHEVLEKFVFEVKQPTSSISQIEDQYLIYLEQALRGFCLKINTCNAVLSPLPPDATFAIQVYTNESTAFILDANPTFQDFPWVKAEPMHVNMNEACIIPLKSVDHELLMMQLYVEENGKRCIS